MREIAREPCSVNFLFALLHMHAITNIATLRTVRAFCAAAGLVLTLQGDPLAAQFGNIGLSGVGGQRFANEDLLFFEPQNSDVFARTLATGDFNGDGADDLATGIPYDNGITGFEIFDCGALIVRYGIPGEGLESGLADTYLSQIGGGSPDPAEEADHFGDALAACDFNGDGKDDLAIGIPDEDVSGAASAGAVQIYYGSDAGLQSPGPFLTQATPGIPGDPEAQDLFGFSLACGDFDGDGKADLAIGVPQESNSSFGHVGIVEVVYGSASGLDPASTEDFDQDKPSMAGSSETCDYFGKALAVGDFDSDGFADLVIGVPGEDNPNWCAAGAGRGAVQLVMGDALGLRADRNVLFTESDLGGASEDGDRFGMVMAAGDFDGDLFDDLAIGSPYEDVNSGGSIPDGGQVIAIYGSSGSPPFFALARTQIWTDSAIHGTGSTESEDFFGFSLAAGDFDRDGRDDLAIGGMGEFVLVPKDGMVTVVMGSPAGITAARRHGLTAGRDGNPGVANQANRSYGYAVTTGDFDGDGYADLAIGAPNEDVPNGTTTIADAGAEVVLYGSLFANNFDNGDPGYWSDTVP